MLLENLNHFHQFQGLRSAYDLYDRRSHKQSIALKDKDARASWINIAAGTFSASAAGATQLITQAAQSGQNISHLTRNTIRFMNVGALSLHTTGCLDGFHTMLSDFYNGEPISKVHLTQLSASLFLLTHSIRFITYFFFLLNSQNIIYIFALKLLEISKRPNSC